MLRQGRVYNLDEFVRELKASRVLHEKQEFKPKKGNNVDGENSKNNKKAVNDILKGVKEFDGGLNDKPKRDTDPENEKRDYNKTPLDVRFTVEPNKGYKDRVKKQVLGYPSVDNAKMHKSDDEDDNGGVDYSGNKKFYDARKENSQEIEQRREDVKHSGLAARTFPSKNFTSKTLFNTSKTLDNTSKKIYKENKNNKKMKRLNFGKTVFLNEEDMLKRIPDDYKVDGNKFYMRDAVGNDYLVECVKDDVVDNFVHTIILSYCNKQQLNETLNRMKSLYGFKSEESKSNMTESLGNFSNLLTETKKKLIKEDVNGEVLYDTEEPYDDDEYGDDYQEYMWRDFQDTLKQLDTHDYGYVVFATVGRWDGTHKAYPEFEDELLDAVLMCLKGADDAKVVLNDGALEITTKGHDGKSEFIIKALSSEGSKGKDVLDGYGEEDDYADDENKDYYDFLNDDNAFEPFTLQK